ncbi:MAG: universal stress protein [Prolixibacteraceae bacterium]|nr:universal stress protein [Prolixibacteraceae bacterium]
MKTNQIKHVLVAVDYDPTAQMVAEQGYSLAKSMGAEVTLLHVITDPTYYASTEFSPILGIGGYIETAQIQLDTVDGLRNAAQHFLDKTKRHLDDTNIHTVVNEGDIAETILETAKEMNADVIVLGSRTQKWLENILAGSVTEDVMKQTQVPLFTIPIK